MTEISSPDATLQASWPTEPAGPPPPRRSPFWFLHELPVLIVIALIMAFLLKTFLVQAFYIPSESMQPTLFGSERLGHDRVLVNKLAYRFREPRRGEVIVFIAIPDTTERSLLDKASHLFLDGLGIIQPLDTIYIKRIVGLPGDTVTVTDRGVTIKPANGGKAFRMSEPYINSLEDGKQCGGNGSKCPYGPNFGPFKVPANKYFVMGDNRANSSDSRFSLGPIPRERILGKAFVRIWPWKRWGTIASPAFPEPKPAAKPRTTKPKPKASSTRALGLLEGPGLPMLALAVGAVPRRRRG